MSSIRELNFRESLKTTKTAKITRLENLDVYGSQHIRLTESPCLTSGKVIRGGSTTFEVIRSGSLIRGGSLTSPLITFEVIRGKVIRDGSTSGKVITLPLTSGKVIRGGSTAFEVVG